MPLLQRIRPYAEAVSRWSLVALSGLIPVVFLPGLTVSLPQTKMILIITAVVLTSVSWLLASLAYGVARIPRQPLLYIAALVPIAYIISAAFGDGASALVGTGVEQDTVAAMCLWYALLFFSSLVISARVEVSRTLVRVVAFAAAVLVVFEWVRILSQSQFLSFSGALPNLASTPVGTWHDMGVVVGLFVLLLGSLGGTVLFGQRHGRILGHAFVMLSLSLLFVVNMQDIWFFVSGTAILFGARILMKGIFLQEPLRDQMRSLLPWLLVALLGLGAGLFGERLYQLLPTTLQVPAIEVRPSWQGTYSIGRQALSGPDALLLGSGPNSFTGLWAQHKPVGVNQTLFWDVDFTAGVGVIPTAFVTTGVLGALAWTLLFLGILLMLLRTLRVRRTFNVSDVMDATPIVIGAAYLFALHIVHVPGIAISALLFLFLGTVVGLRSATDTRPSVPLSIGTGSYGNLLRLGVIGVVLLSVLVMAVLALRMIVSNVLVNRSVVVYSTTGDVGHTERLIARAVAVDKGNDRAHRAAVELGLVQLQALIQSGQQDESTVARLQLVLSTTIAHGLSALEIDRADYQNWIALAQFYQELAGIGVGGAYDEAKRAYSEAAAENPTSPLPSLRLAQLEFATGKQDVALEALATALALKPSLVAAHLLRSHIYATAKQYQPAAVSALTAAQLVPEDPVGWYNLGTILYADGKYREAVVAFNTVITLRADHANALYLIALSFHELGADREAIAALEKVAALNPDEKIIRTMIESLRAGKGTQPAPSLGR